MSFQPNFYAGPRYLSDGRCEFVMHAPDANSLSLTFTNDGINWFTRPMQNLGNGDYYLVDGEVKPGARYWYVIDDVDGYPDPWSRFQPDGPHSASQVISGAEYNWHDQHWFGHSWNEAVIYELHVGAFTKQGTFLAAIDKLKLLQELGITVVQIMPIWTVPGGPSWGYDANYMFSVNAEYGQPDDLKRFVDAAHSLGIQVILDVVYNHLGIEGNYLSKFDRTWLRQDDGNQWGAKLNFDKPGFENARNLVVSNALFWLREYHLDGLRIDAPIAIEDGSKTHILTELAETVRNNFSEGRHIHLLLENDHYAGRITDGFDDLLYDGSTNIKGGECLVELFQGDSGGFDVKKTASLMDCLKGNIGFDFNAEFPTRTDAVKFLHSDRQTLGLQSHDLIGNSHDPQRIWANLEGLKRELALAIMCLTPSLPTFFMGDEFTCDQVFPFFCKFSDVNEAEVLQGRIEDFQFSENLLDYWSPYSRDTFEAATLDWPDNSSLKCNANYQLIGRLLKIRQQFIMPLSESGRIVSSNYLLSDDRHQVSWDYQSGRTLIFELTVNRIEKTGWEQSSFFWLDGESWSARWSIV